MIRIIRRMAKWLPAAALMTITCSAALGNHMIVAYLPNWIDLNQIVDTVDYSRLTHINIAFENPLDSAGQLSFTAADDPVIERSHRHRVKVLVSIGGGSASEDKVLRERYFALISEPNRPAFVTGLVDYVVQHRFDGIDVDLEGPAINSDFGPFITDLSKALKSKHKLITCALSQGYGGDHVPDTVFGDIDFVNIMAYDATGTWDRNSPGQHSSYEFAISNAEYWIGRGLMRKKAVLGVPFYGYGFGSAFRNHDYSYSEIVGNYPGAENSDQVGDTIWYNGIPTIQAKAQYVVDQHLAGVMIWSLDYDVPGDKSLLTALHTRLKHPEKRTGEASASD